MGLDLTYIAGQTPLSEDEKEGLKIPTIATKGELDEFEQQNIEQAVEWALSRTFSLGQIFREQFIKNVHRRMLGNVWKWAGDFRTTNKNIGVDKWQIATSLKGLLDDAQYWINRQVFSPAEIAIRFKHRLVSIHCFPNGNGRHSRLMADILIKALDKQIAFSWGAGDLGHKGHLRDAYLAAVKAADKDDIKPLLIFANPQAGKPAG
ncbi:cell filamentation protein Fic [Niabella ginsenosidivorans]|uniref:Cell filamentation protein Fic n=1 Tax=Niabella ginsenosidivorans TaxID=1176587 RepID=A0A1A9HYQ7_9BACT|nr:mobile mystery protein B [Niabella ginsenosidivorans]ANH80215.1 cell filamentation protein Fic [Niabella ginsenosidivorans]